MRAFAQEESRNISERVKKGLRMRARKVEVSWTPLYGYRKEGAKEFIIVPEEAEVIRQIFNDYEKGAFPKKTVEQINAMGLPSPGGQLK